MIASVFKVIFYVLGGVCLGTINLFAFMMPLGHEEGFRFFLIIYGVAAVLFISTALAIGKLKNWKRPLAATLFVISIFAAMFAASIWVMLQSDDPIITQNTEAFSMLLTNMPLGLGITTFYTVIGFMLTYWANRDDAKAGQLPKG